MLVNPIASNLKRLRTIKKKRQEEIADAAGISRMAYYAMEKGKSKPRIKNLEKVADALNVSIGELMSAPPELKHVRFRCPKCNAEEKKLRDDTINDIAFKLRDVDFLEKVLDKKKDHLLKEFNYNKHASFDKISNDFRKFINIKADEPINNLTELIETLDINVFYVDLDVKDFFGLSLMSDEYGNAIVINDRDDITTERKIFTIAHELGHLIMHKGSFEKKLIEENEIEEREANGFASHFLMPQRGFEKTWAENNGVHLVENVLYIKRVYRVSYQVVLFRLVEIGFPANIWKNFNYSYRRITNKSLSKKEEPAGLSKYDFIRDGIQKLVKEAYENGKISFGRAAELLNKSIVEMRDLRQGWVNMK